MAYVHLLEGYGLGLGALIRKMIHIDPSVGLPLGLRVSYRTVIRAARSSVRGDGCRSGDRAMLKGIVKGAALALAVPIAGERFIDENPPPLVEIDDPRNVHSSPFEPSTGWRESTGLSDTMSSTRGAWTVRDSA
jgi:hypothetical protein